MKVFISFSGDRSLRVARALRDWIPQVVQAARPFLSEDIPKGSNWPAELAAALNDCTFGIVCLTPESIGQPWTLFEAGALSKAMGGEKAYVCPYLVGLTEPDVPNPLGLLQLTIANEDDTLRLMKSLNARLPDASRLPDPTLEKVFKRSWAELRDELKTIGESGIPAEHPRNDRELLEDILGLLRAQEQRETVQEETRRRQAVIRAALDPATRLRGLGGLTLGDLIRSGDLTAGTESFLTDPTLLPAPPPLPRTPTPPSSARSEPKGKKK